eukprot:TRINITY_DN7077_c0_g2_i1.p4 TRINITY_DN7077_c0_g2~~TRINITY_DN7077_c0_g2_i1.p4  ORF type:complete len:118 (-),score=34.94 TRINITY_DN7077_c0_g2_i1:176-529(-)
MQRGLVGSEMCIRDSINAEYMGPEAMLSRLLLPKARERLSGIALVKPDKARKIEDSILTDAQFGKIMSQMTEEELIKRIEEMDSKDKPTTIQFSHKFKDPEDDIDLSGLQSLSLIHI